MSPLKLALLSALLPLPLLSAVAASALQNLEWRNIGRAVMGGRISAIAGEPQRLYVAAASGGVFRTDNDGTTFTAVFDRQTTISIAAVAVEPGNSKVIWVGTGESKFRNSVSFGDGIYQSSDTGHLAASWLRK